jgi:hypothetical protein
MQPMSPKPCRTLQRPAEGAVPKEGQVPPGQLGMNVEIWIEPIPDVVIFRDSGRLAAPEQREHPAPHAHGYRGQGLRKVPWPTPSRRDGERRAQARGAADRGAPQGDSDVLPAIVAVDTAPEAKEQMTPHARRGVEATAH